MKRKQKVKKTFVEEETPLLNPTQQAILKISEKLLPLVDEDLAKFAICSALSLKGEKFCNTLSMCYTITSARKNENSGRELSEAEQVNENMQYLNAIGLVLGNNIVEN